MAEEQKVKRTTRSKKATTTEAAKAAKTEPEDKTDTTVPDVSEKGQDGAENASNDTAEEGGKDDEKPADTQAQEQKDGAADQQDQQQSKGHCDQRGNTQKDPEPQQKPVSLKLRVTSIETSSICMVSGQPLPKRVPVVITYKSLMHKRKALKNFNELNALAGRQRFVVEE